MQRHLILLAAFLAYTGAASSTATARDMSPLPCAMPLRGEYGASLDFLRQHYSPPQHPGESNHFIDLWAEQSLPAFARECKLTNAHALFINSHGGGLPTAGGTKYAYYPHQSLLKPAEKPPRFSAADVAVVLGPQNAAQIHNILISGCNADASFDARELRRCFINATNVMHMPAGRSGYQQMFRQILISRSSSIQPVYETCAKNRQGKTEFFMGKNPSANATQLSPYIAELFKPGDTAPFRVQAAGREILAPAHPSFLGP